jgi:hypothetical protein
MSIQPMDCPTPILDTRLFIRKKPKLEQKDGEEPEEEFRIQMLSGINGRPLEHCTL